MSDSYLSRLYYASTATEKYSPLEMGNILEACRRNNPVLNITGMLFMKNNFFFQCLEGPRENVNILYKKIRQDERHSNVQLLEFKEVGSRYFEGWAMKYVSSAAVIGKILKETGVQNFNPYIIDNYTLNLMIAALRDQPLPESSSKVDRVKQEKSALFRVFKPVY